MDKQAFHRKAAQAHAENRVQQRFDDPDLLKKIERMFKRNARGKIVVRGGKKYHAPTDAEYFERFRMNGRIRATIIIDGKSYTAVYDERLKTVVTVWDPNAGREK